MHPRATVYPEVVTLYPYRAQNSPNIAVHPHVSDKESRKLEAVLRIAERHFTAAEFSELMAAFSDGTVDVRVYDDGIVLMRRF